METDLLAQLITEKHTVLRQLHDISQCQLSLVAENGDVTRLLGLLATKQTLIESLNDVERRLQPFRAQDPDQRKWRSVEDRQRCAQIAEQSRLLLQKIVEMEKQGETDLKRRRDQTATQLQAATNATEAREAYAHAAHANAGAYAPTHTIPMSRHHLDLTSES